MPLMTLDQEFDFLLLLLKSYLKGKAAPISTVDIPIDWMRLLQMANFHRVTPVVYRVLKEVADVPADMKETLRRIVLNQSVYNVRAARRLGMLLRRFYENKLSIIPFKGLVLAAELYGDEIVRPSVDFDLYVPKNKVSESTQLLHAMGYFSALQQNNPSLKLTNVFHTLEFSHRQDKTHIDLHWDPTDGYVSRLYSQKQLEGATRILDFENEPIRIFDQDVTLTLVAVHGAKNSWAFLSTWLDLAQFYSRYPHYSYSTLLKRMQDRGVARMLYVGSQLVERFFDVTIPAVIKRNIDYRSIEISRFIGHRLLQQPSSPAGGGWDKVILNLQLREKWSEKVRYLYFKSRPKKVDVGESTRLSRALHHLRRVVRGT